MQSNGVNEQDLTPRRAYRAGAVTVASPELVEMDEATFESTVEAKAAVIRLDWDLASALLANEPF